MNEQTKTLVSTENHPRSQSLDSNVVFLFLIKFYYEIILRIGNKIQLKKKYKMFL